MRERIQTRVGDLTFLFRARAPDKRYTSMSLPLEKKKKLVNGEAMNEFGGTRGKRSVVPLGA